MVLLQDALPTHCGHHRTAEPLGQRANLVVRIGRDCPATRDDDRARGCGERHRCGGDSGVLGHRSLRGSVHGLEHGSRLARRPAEHVVGDRQHDRPRAAARGDREGDAQAVVERGGARHARDPLRDAREHRDLIECLGGVAAGAAVLPVARDVRDDRKHRDRRAVGLRDPRHEIGGSGSDRGIAHSDPAGDPAVGVGGTGRAALVAHQDVLDPRRLEDAAVERQRLPARHAEHVPDACRAQAAREPHSDCLGGCDHRSPAS